MQMRGMQMSCEGYRGPSADLCKLESGSHNEELGGGAPPTYANELPVSSSLGLVCK
jgi:hypothetical protein